MSHQNKVNHLAEITLEQLGIEWEEHYRPEDIRLDMEKVLLLREVNRQVEWLELAKCPTFVSVYEAVMLRSIQEPIPYGTDRP